MLELKTMQYKGKVNNILHIKDTLQCFPNSSTWMSSRHPKFSMTMAEAAS